MGPAPHSRSIPRDKPAPLHVPNPMIWFIPGLWRIRFSLFFPFPDTKSEVEEERETPEVIPELFQGLNTESMLRSSVTRSFLGDEPIIPAPGASQTRPFQGHSKVIPTGIHQELLIHGQGSTPGLGRDF